MSNQTYKIGDSIKLTKELEPNSIDTIITSPPYWGLRDYGVDNQLGLESTLKEYHDKLLNLTQELYRVLKPSGIMFWNHGDSYGGSGGSGGDYNIGGSREGQLKVSGNKYTPKCMMLQNERLIIKMIDNQGWILRNRIIWHKPSCMPFGGKDRLTNVYEPIYMLTKNKNYYFNLDSIRNLTGKNPGDVWTIQTANYKGSHFATFPNDLIEPLIKCGCPKDGIVLDPFLGSGTTLEVCRNLDRDSIGFEINPEYEEMIKNRIMSNIPQLDKFF